jgi:hypothetical protein
MTKRPLRRWRRQHPHHLLTGQDASSRTWVAKDADRRPRHDQAIRWVEGSGWYRLEDRRWQLWVRGSGAPAAA